MDIMAVLKKHENEIKERYHVKRIGLFGSYAKHEENEKSDIDILVEFENPTLHNFMGLIDYLENVFGKKVDLVTQKSLNPYLRPIVEKEVLWCE